MPSERRSHLGVAWVGPALVSVIVVSVIVVASGGAARLLLLGGLAVAVLGFVALVRGRVRWARMSRRSGALTVAAGLIASLVGSAMSVQPTPTLAATPVETVGRGVSVSTPSPPVSSSSSATTASSSATATMTKSVAAPSISPVKAGSALAALATLAVKGGPRKWATIGAGILRVDASGPTARLTSQYQSSAERHGSSDEGVLHPR